MVTQETYSRQHPAKTLPYTCMVMSSSTPTRVYRHYMVLNAKQAFRITQNLNSLVPAQGVLCCVLVPHFVALYHITDSNLISRPVGLGEAQKSQQTEVRTQEREAECNRGRTTCRPA